MAVPRFGGTRQSKHDQQPSTPIGCEKQRRRKRRARKLNLDFYSRMQTHSLLLFRTHYVDDAVFSLAATLSQQACLDLVFVVDETRGPIDTRGIGKVSLTYDHIDRAGLHRHFERPTWRCGDYGFYLAQQMHPGYAHYWMIEHDVRINYVHQREFFAQYTDCDVVDLLAPYFAESGSEWFWHRSMTPFHLRVYRCLFPVIRLSHKAIGFLFERRRSIGVAFASRSDGPECLWPNDEAFVATELANNGFVCRDLNAIGRTQYTRRSMTFTTPISQADFSSLRPDGLIYHPVLYGQHYAKKLLAMTAASGDVLSARQQISRLVGREWSQQEADTYQRELSQIPPAKWTRFQRLRRVLSPFVTRVRWALDIWRRS